MSRYRTIEAFIPGMCCPEGRTYRTSVQLNKIPIFLKIHIILKSVVVKYTTFFRKFSVIFRKKLKNLKIQK